MNWKSALLLLTAAAAFSGAHAEEAGRPNDPSSYMEWKRSDDPRFITAVSRLTACKIGAASDLRNMAAQYPPESRRDNEEGKVVMRLQLDAALCVRKATIVQSSNHFRLDKASLDFAMNLKFPPAAISDIKSVEDGEVTFNFPIDWKLNKAVDPCSSDPSCVDHAPPPAQTETKGKPPKANSIWVAGYYLYDPKLGYQWTKGHWEAPRPGYHWVEPKWEQAGAKWHFIPNGWLAVP